MKISHPTELRYCTVDQMAQYSTLIQERGIKSAEDMIRATSDIYFRIEIVSIFTGQRKDLLRTISIVQITKMFNAIISMISSHQYAEPAGFVKIDGKRYVYEKDFKRISSGQVIDLKMLGETINNNPARAMAILYVEEGMKHSQTDADGFVINPTENREKIFIEHFPGDEFLNVCAFFLNSYVTMNAVRLLMEAREVNQTKKKILKDLEQEVKKIRRTRNGTTGRNSFAKFLNRRGRR